MTTLHRQRADECAAQTFVDMAIRDVHVQQTVLTPSTQLTHAYARMEADLESPWGPGARLGRPEGTRVWT